MSSTDIVRASFNAYLAQDRETAERLLAEDFVFTSPQDDHISKAEFLERCFPTADRTYAGLSRAPGHGGSAAQIFTP